MLQDSNIPKLIFENLVAKKLAQAFLSLKDRGRRLKKKKNIICYFPALSSPTPKQTKTQKWGEKRTEISFTSYSG